MDIEALVKKHISRNGWSFAHDGECAKSLRAALTELAADYENFASVTKTNSERLLRKANERIAELEVQSVPVVGEPDCYDAGLLNDFGGGNVEWWQDYIRAELARAHDFYVSQWPTDAAELASLRENLAKAEQERDELRKDAERYRWLREQSWDAGELCIVSQPKHAVKLGHDCPSLFRLDAAIDAAIAQGKGE